MLSLSNLLIDDKLELMKPSGRRGRAIDTLGHYQRCTDATGESIGDGGLELWWNFFVTLFFDVSYSPGPTSRAGPT